MASTTASPQYQVIPIEQLKPLPFNPRKFFDQKDLDELAKSIREKGILEPLLVRPNGTGYEIICGERRYRAAKIVKQVQPVDMPCMVRTVTDTEALEMMVIENNQRANVSEMEEARGYAELMKRAKYDAKMIADKMGRSERYVWGRIKLLELVQLAQNALETHKISVSHAIQIARLQPKDQERTLTFATKTWQEYEGEHDYLNTLNPEKKDGVGGYKSPAQTVCSVKDLTDFIERRILLDLRDAAFDKKDEQLVMEAGSCINCPKRSGFNKELFADIAKNDICTDPVCFQLKQQTHVERLKATLKKEKKRFIEVTADQRKPEGHGGAITERSFKKISGKPCRFARTGIYIDGANMGKTVTICKAKRECKQHWGEYQKQRSHANRNDNEPRISYEEQQRRRQEKVKRAEKRFVPVAREIWNSIPKEFPKKFDAVARLAELLEKAPSYDFEQCKPKGLKLTPVQVVNVGLLCRKYKFNVSYEGVINPDIYKAAKSLGVKFEPILQKVSDEEKVPTKPVKSKGRAKRGK